MQLNSVIKVKNKIVIKVEITAYFKNMFAFQKR